MQVRGCGTDPHAHGRNEVAMTAPPDLDALARKPEAGTLCHDDVFALIAHARELRADNAKLRCAERNMDAAYEIRDTMQRERDEAIGELNAVHSTDARWQKELTAARAVVAAADRVCESVLEMLQGGELMLRGTGEQCAACGHGGEGLVKDALKNYREKRAAYNAIAEVKPHE